VFGRTESACGCRLRFGFRLREARSAEAIAAGRQPPELTAHRLIRTVDLPIAWTAQKQLLGLG
jgi:hypothetical protein